MLIPFNGLAPRIAATAYIQSSARLIGDVLIGEESSIWFNAVLRGDVNSIRIGARTNIQDNATVHVTTDRWPTAIGDDVTVGHGVILHGCTIANRCLIGIGAIILDGCDIADECLIGAGSLVTPGMKIPAGQLVLGSPAKVIRPLHTDELAHLRQSASNYAAHAARYRSQGID